ncbi:hypothetical protein [Lysinibacillus sp. Y5S-8]|uniref:hypothetical protein n=1 Tax=Lysinibacillus sp. Y5S-8 TaxID=3122488 RepID=UPI0030CDCBE7
MIVSFTGFMFTFEVPEEEKIDVVETVAKSEEESSTNTSDDTVNKEQTVNTENSQKQPQATKDNQKEDTQPETEPSKPSTLTIGEKNAELNPTKPGATGTIKFEVDCPPGVHCLIDPNFDVIIDFTTKKVVEIIGGET